MTIQEIIHQAQTLTLPEQISLMRQLSQLIEENIQISTSQANTEVLASSCKAEPPNSRTKTDFRELSGFLYRPEQPTISVEAMNRAIEEEATRLL